MVEGARLESVCTVILYREFESLTLRHFCPFSGRAAAFGSCAMAPPEPRQVRKEAALRESCHVPQGRLGAAVRREKGREPSLEFRQVAAERLLFYYGS